MKEKIKQTRDRIVDSARSTLDFIKEHPKEIIMIAGLGAGGYIVYESAPNAYAGNIEARAAATSNPESQPTANLKHSGGDVSYIPPFSGDIGIYFKRGENKLVEKVIDANNTNSEGMWAEKNGGDSPNGKEWWQFNILDVNDLDWKNVFVHRYGQDAVDNPNAPPEDTFDVKYVDGTWIQSGSFKGQFSGIYDRLKFESFDDCDLNRDQKVNFADYAIFARNWKRTGINKGENPNNLDDYADIDGDGDADMNDLDIFMGEWLYVADPNGFISKLTPNLQKRFLEGLLNSTIYGDKAKTEVLKVVKVSPDRTRGHYAGHIPEIAGNGRYQPQNQKPTLKQMLALSPNGHDKALSRHYSTIDNKLPTNHRVLQASQNGKNPYQRPAA